MTSSSSVKPITLMLLFLEWFWIFSVKDPGRRSILKNLKSYSLAVLQPLLRGMCVISLISLKLIIWGNTLVFLLPLEGYLRLIVILSSTRFVLDFLVGKLACYLLLVRSLWFPLFSLLFWIITCKALFSRLPRIRSWIVFLLNSFGDPLRIKGKLIWVKAF